MFRRKRQHIAQVCWCPIFTQFSLSKLGVSVSHSPIKQDSRALTTSLVHHIFSDIPWALVRQKIRTRRPTCRAVVSTLSVEQGLPIANEEKRAVPCVVMGMGKYLRFLGCHCWSCARTYWRHHRWRRIDTIRCCSLTRSDCLTWVRGEGSHSWHYRVRSNSSVTSKDITPQALPLPLQLASCVEYIPRLNVKCVLLNGFRLEYRSSRDEQLHR